MKSYLLLALILFAGILSNAQNWAPAHWQTTTGQLDSGEVKVPKIMLTKAWQIRYRSQTGIPLEGENIDWLVTNGDTLFYRDHHDIGTSTLYQQVVGGEVDLYHGVARKGAFDWQLHSSLGYKQVDLFDVPAQMRAMVGDECPNFELKSKDKPTTYNLLLATEEINHCLEPDALRYSFLGKPFKWRLNFGLITPINLINQSDNLGAYWGIRVATERNFRRLFNGFHLTAGLQPYYYRQTSNLTLGPLNGTYAQEWEMSALQTNIGGKLEPFPTFRVSPFAELGFGMVIPFSHQRYAILKEGEPQSPGYPIVSSVKGGMKTSYGIYWAYGIKAKYNEKWAVLLQISRDGMFVDVDYGDLSGGSRSLFFNQDNALLIGEWQRWELLLQRQF
ncbi:MAG: hypothetical protein ACRBG0_15260 [Lewinella sp.]|uniref:hypothetical protein n=1 Tax=Lewinella sp. TaxID=2004506 RepID=UPI003D6B3A4D